MAYGYADSIFTAVIDENGDIYEASTGRKRQKVGVDSQREQEFLQQIAEMQETLDNWRPKMVEHGYIVLPKTPEEIAQEAAAEQIRLVQEQANQQLQISNELLKVVTSLEAKIKEMESNGASRNSNESGIQPVGQNSPGNRKATGGGKGRDKSGAEDTSGDS